MVKKFLLKAVCALVLTAAVIACAPVNAANEDEFLSARDAFRAGDARKLDFLSLIHI